MPDQKRYTPLSESDTEFGKGGGWLPAMLRGRGALGGEYAPSYARCGTKFLSELIILALKKFVFDMTRKMTQLYVTYLDVSTQHLTLVYSKARSIAPRKARYNWGKQLLPVVTNTAVLYSSKTLEFLMYSYSYKALNRNHLTLLFHNLYIINRLSVLKEGKWGLQPPKPPPWIQPCLGNCYSSSDLIHPYTLGTGILSSACDLIEVLTSYKQA